MENDLNFYKFGVRLVSSDKKVAVKIIQGDSTKPKLEDKCLALIELWVRSVKGPKWQDLTEAASKSSFDGFATALTTELSSRKEPKKESVKPAEGGGNYKHYKLLYAS